MPDNVAIEIAETPQAPALSESNWKAPVEPAAPAADAGGNAATPPTEGKPAATQTPAAEGGEGEGGAPGAADEGGEGDGEGAGTVKDPPADPAADPAAEAKAGRKRATMGDRISELTRSKKEAEQTRDRALGLLERAVEKLGGDPAARPPGEGRDPPAPAPVVDPRPSRGNFDDPDAYDAAVDQWAIRSAGRIAEQKLREADTQRQARETEERQRENFGRQRQRDLDQWNTERAALVEDPRFADFDEVALREDIMIPHQAVPLLTRAGPKVLHHLAQDANAAKRDKILKMFEPGDPTYDPIAATGELFVLRDRLANPPASVSRTPAPIKPIGSGAAAAAAKDPADMTMAEYEAHRLPKIQAERRNSMFGNRN